MARISTVLAVAGITVLASFAAYAAYFDYKRRTDASFRKKLKKQHKKVDKFVKLDASTSKSQESTHDLKAALAQIRLEPVPDTVEAKEKYFLENVALGEQLCTRGPLFDLPAALAFYRALRVYPAPVELIMIYQKTVPDAVFKIVMELTNHDVKERAEGYYDHWPPVVMNVAVKEIPLKQGAAVVQSLEADKPNLLRRALVAKKDFAAGELIYKEQPMATALDLDLEGKGTHCSYCLRKLEAYMSIRPPNDPLGSTFCSKACQLACTSQSHNLLFGNTVLLPANATTQTPTPEDAEKRRDVQVSFAEYVKASGKLSPLLVARCVARMISNEIVKLAPGSQLSPPPPSDLPEADTAGSTASLGTEYTFYDHVERLRFLEIPPTPAEDVEIELVRNVLNSAMAGLDEFIQDERYLVLKGKIMYNAIGVSFGGGRLDKPKSGGRFEKWELTRTPYGTSRQTGTGFYRVSSYLAHSCSPSARPSFPKGTAELHLIANRPIIAGEELTISYVRSAPTEGESVAENRRIRRQELARGWRFACECAKCTAEAAEGAAPDSETKAPRSE